MTQNCLHDLLKGWNNKVSRPCPFQSNCGQSGATADNLNMDKSNFFPDDQQVEEKKWDHSMKVYS